MQNKKILFLLVLTMIVVGAVSYGHAGERFGPWKYYAPYYFPPEGCMGHCWSPLDFLPTYETPPPPRPSYDPGGMTCQAPPAIRKVTSPYSAAVHGSGPIRPQRMYQRSQIDNSTKESASPRVNRRSTESLGTGGPRAVEHPGPQPHSFTRPAPTSRAY
ncbi:MAG: hypothetical protein HY912_16810 [Desulfomonile tiedjei]|uniref:Uncharacterized protein n=1 Tax=Desulfomonile tiedjei TaxID=2358 RepID=A0A9D6V301_9BACT|nr:hypothetical protein [Desulfomonile tiedjei]